MQALHFAIANADRHIGGPPEGGINIARQPEIGCFPKSDALLFGGIRPIHGISRHIARGEIGRIEINIDRADIGGVNRLNAEVAYIGRGECQFDIVLLGAQHGHRAIGDIDRQLVRIDAFFRRHEFGRHRHGCFYRRALCRLGKIARCSNFQQKRLPNIIVDNITIDFGTVQRVNRLC